MTDASTPSDERVDEAPNRLQTPDECRILTDGGEAQAAEQEEESGGEDGDAASNGQSESAEAESGAEAEDESEDYEEDEGTTVLFLDLEGLFLDLLGLEVDLDEVVLDVSAVSGPGNLLGNLLDAVSGLLGSGDSGLLMDLVGGSLFEGITSDEDGEGGLFGDFLSSGEGGKGEDGEGDGEDGESRVSEAAGSVKESLSEAFADVPFDEILTSVLKELVEQMFEDSDDGGESGSGSEA
ncbi:hypothetical protein [Halogeometricum sp. CBA1124]|uniref:hypothetical protein n=1 Tax=Halogeometricum sp. CBA1124 TaxID=2668071 RepID=UPI00142C3125|nr:hypothetical protein [Halogeometricum sp. CBA1124]MUV57787.1 hypothetical protein [Halogeometricum sp. CBA1124]